jgi:hypothetical protein
MKDLAMNAPPKASIANRTQMVKIVLKFLGLIPAKFSFCVSSYFSTLASIAWVLSIIQYAMDLSRPKKA